MRPGPIREMDKGVHLEAGHDGFQAGVRPRSAVIYELGPQSRPDGTLDVPAYHLVSLSDDIAAFSGSMLHNDRMKITRRTLAISALATAAAAQQPTSDELDQARKQVELTSQVLLKFEVAMSAEPAFQFKA
jgi:hypothetical protein